MLPPERRVDTDVQEWMPPIQDWFPDDFFYGRFNIQWPDDGWWWSHDFLE
jgi:hypothetical protein